MLRTLLLGAVLGAVAASALAQEALTYTYDVHGQLIEVARSSGPQTDYAYDDGDSRTSKVTTGAAFSSATASPSVSPSQAEPAEHGEDQVDAEPDLETPENR